MCPIYTKIFNIILSSGIIPTEWTLGQLTPIFKNKGDRKKATNYRGITLFSCLSKLFTSVLNDRLTKWVTDKNIIGPEQAGFRKGFSTVDHIFTLKCIVDVYLSKRKRLYCAFIDYQKAFDSIDRLMMWKHILKN